MSNIVLVSGTDTGIGKTWVTCALARALGARGRRVLAVKPVETGCEGVGDEQEDGALLAAATGQAAPRRALYRLRAPLAPAPALDLEERTIDFDEMVLEIERLAADVDVLLLEGTGGLLVPLTWEWNVTDLAAALGARVLLVGADRLGTINHMLVTLSAVELSGLQLAGVVLSGPERPDASTGRNAAAITRLNGISRVFTAPWTTDPATAAAALDGVAAWIDEGSPA